MACNGCICVSCGVLGGPWAERRSCERVGSCLGSSNPSDSSTRDKNSPTSRPNPELSPSTCGLVVDAIENADVVEWMRSAGDSSGGIHPSVARLVSPGQAAAS